MQELNQAIEQLNQKIELANTLDRLNQNADFKALTRYLFDEKAKQTTKALAKFARSSDSYQMLIEQLTAISYLQECFDTIIDDGQVALYELHELKQIPQDSEYNNE